MSFTFNPDYWVDESLNPLFAGWLKPVKYDPSIVLCFFFVKTISLSNMGKQTFTSHLDSVKHNKYMVRCAIWYHLYSLKNVKNTHADMLVLVKLQAEAYIIS